jgi:hypothetical protein
MPNVPMIAYYISGMEYEQKRTQDPYFIDNQTVRMRSYNPTTGHYETTQGNAFTVKRIMPVPYKLSVTVDIWTSSEQQRLEIFEQLGVLFNPSIEIQSTDNFVDWTSLSVVYQDSINWSSRSVPQGNGNEFDVFTWKFSMPIWISSPIKVEKLGMIQKVIASIYKGSALVDLQNQDLLLGQRQKITPYGYKLLLTGNKLQILPSSEVIDENDNFDVIGTGPNTSVYWHSVLNAYGKVRPGVSQISLENEWMSTEIVGTIDFDPDDDRLLTFTIDPDTLPLSTLTSVTSIINPHLKQPGNNLPASAVGQRYLVVNDIPQQRDYVISSGVTPDWMGLTAGAHANDIIEYGSHVTSIISAPNYTGSTTLQLTSIDGVVVGYVVTDKLSGVTLGTVLSVDYSSMSCVIDTALTVDIINGDVLNFTGTGWFISYDSLDPVNLANVDYVVNNTTGVQYRINEGVWRQSYTGFYSAGNWRVII